MKQQTDWERLWLYLKTFAKWLALALAVGVGGGAAGSAFHYALTKVTGYRQQHSFSIFLLPVLGLFIVFLYRQLGLSGHRGTNGVFEAVRSGEKVPLALAPGIFIGTVLTHLGGGSAGREGAALQMGGSIGAALARLLRLSAKESRILIMCGMSAVFSALFGTPLTATLFCLEVVDVGVFQFSALLPCMISALTAFRCALAAGIAAPHYVLLNAPMDFSSLHMGGVLLLGAISGGMSIVLCRTMRKSGQLYQKWFPNPYLRVLAGAAGIVLLTLLCKTQDYNGAGMALAEYALTGQKVLAGAFLLKLLFTALTLGAGFRGGEIVPTLCIGATLGSVLAPIVGLDPGFAAAVGMIAVFCGAVNSPVSSIVLSVEFFGSECLLYFALACAVSYLLSGRHSLYASQKLIYSKLEPGPEPACAPQR